MIKPTVGRVVWYYPANASIQQQPFAALIAFVHDDTMINVGGFDNYGIIFSDTNVLLLQDEGSYGNPSGGAWCCWMPYQKAVASGSQDPTLHAT